MLTCTRGRETKQIDQQTSVCIKGKKNELTLYLHIMWFTSEKIKAPRAKQNTKKLSKMEININLNISTLMDGPASHPTLFSTQTKHQLYFSQIFSGTSTLYRRSKSIIITLLLQIYEINTLLAYIPIPPKRSVGCSLLLCA